MDYNILVSWIYQTLLILSVCFKWCFAKAASASVLFRYFIREFAMLNSVELHEVQFQGDKKQRQCSPSVYFEAGEERVTSPYLLRTLSVSD